MANLVPGVALEISDIQSASLETASKIVIFGIIQGGSLLPNVAAAVTSPEEGKLLGGTGSQLAQMISGTFAEFRQADITVIGMAPPAGAAAAGTFTFGAGPATTANPILIGIEDRVITVPVAVGDTGTNIAATASALLNNGTFDDLHVGAAPALGVLTLTAKSLGLHGDQVRLRNVGTLPPGVTSAVVAMTGGAGSPDLATAIAALPGVRYKYWVCPDTEATNLTALQTELDERWTKQQQIDGQAVIGLRDTVSNLASFGVGEDTKQISVFGDPNWLANPWVWASVIVGERASIENPKFTMYTKNLSALVAPPDTEFLDVADRETLLVSGIATLQIVAGNSRVERFATLAKTNSLAQPSVLFFDAETKLTAAEIRQLMLIVLKPEIGKTLVDDASAVDYDIETAANIIDPEGIKQILINLNDEVFEPRAWTDNSDYFEKNLQVVRTGQNEVTINSSPPITGTNYRNVGTIEVVFSFGTGN